MPNSVIPKVFFRGRCIAGNAVGAVTCFAVVVLLAGAAFVAGPKVRPSGKNESRVLPHVTNIARATPVSPLHRGGDRHRPL